MPDTDEYDDYYSPIDHEELVNIEVAAIAAYTQREETPAPVSPPETQSTQQSHKIAPPSPPSDEFDSYDFSEFTAADFERIDASIRAHMPHDMPASPPTPYLYNTALGRRANRSGGRRGARNGGPQVEIALEGVANANLHRVLKGPQARSTPFQQFRRWNNVLSVTDLVGPSWCEVQFDYGLRQKRYRKLEDRPQSFMTAEGKVITVEQNVAAQNDRTVSRGKVGTLSHQPAVFTALTGYCREMPVFGIVHGQVVTGIIDEIARRPIPADSVNENLRRIPGASSPSKRFAPHSNPTTPSKPSCKKSKHDDVPSDQPPITTFFSPTRRQATPSELEGSGPPQYSLHVSDTKTRTRPTLPPDEDAYGSRLQLMLYHRLLSNLFASADPSMPAMAPLDFAGFWAHVDVNPACRFSDNFLLQAGLASSETEPPSEIASLAGAGINCLNDLVNALKHTVHALNVSKVDNTLTLVYRKQPERGSFPRKPRRGSVGDVDMGGGEQLARAIFESLKDSLRTVSASATDADGTGESAPDIFAQPFGVSISNAPGSTTLEGEAMTSRRDTPGAWSDDLSSSDPQLAWALRQSRLEAHATTEHTAILANASTPMNMSRLSEEGHSEPEDVVRSPNLVDQTASAIASDRPANFEGSEAVPPAISPELRSIADNTDIANDAVIATTENTNGGDATKTAPASPARSEDLIEADDTMTVAELNVEARIIGRKEFQLDNSMLDNYLTRVLAWWYGERQPEVHIDATLDLLENDLRNAAPGLEMALSEHRPDKDDDKQKIDAAFFLQSPRPAKDPYDDREAGTVDAYAQTRKQVRGQIIHYAQKIFEYQHRTSLIFLIVFGRRFCLSRWDRSSTIVTRAIDYVEQPQILCDALWHMVRLSDEELGLDSTAHRVLPGTADYVKMIRAKFEPDGIPDIDHTERPLDGFPPADTLPLEPLGSAGWERYALLPRRTTCVLCPWDGAPWNQGIRGSRSQCLPARFVWLKDAWRTNYSFTAPEGVVLKELNDAKVANIPTLVCHGDLPGQETATPTWWDSKNPLSAAAKPSPPAPSSPSQSIISSSCTIVNFPISSQSTKRNAFEMEENGNGREDCPLRRHKH
ncbi:hypothetical protein BN946_scf184649.g26 [Trametes cinnabarina]|uniref:Fungal-type protein kinase domain-containing protein n=1 Tax=Pycnoporus cinnabarinus TaxID=5643 RepID=A0A060SNY2_PYCCI|nr:hypothetical protein BN946_scf184649.g26 [Trametes cinnabarina]